MSVSIMFKWLMWLRVKFYNLHHTISLSLFSIRHVITISTIYFYKKERIKILVLFNENIHYKRLALFKIYDTQIPLDDISYSISNTGFPKIPYSLEKEMHLSLRLVCRFLFHLSFFIQLTCLLICLFVCFYFDSL